MSQLTMQLPLDVHADQLFSWLGSRVMASNPEAAELCRQLVHELGSTTILVNVDCLHVLCQACEFARQKTGLIGKMESLVKMLKSKPALVVGTLDLTLPSLSMLDDRLENLRRTILTANGG